MNLVLFVIGAAVVFWLQVLFCRLTWKKGLAAETVFADTQTTEGEETSLLVTVENRKWLPIATVKTNMEVNKGLDFKDRSNLAVSDKNYRSEIFALRGNEKVVRNIPLFCAKRGFYQIQEIEFVGTDLFYSHRFVQKQKVDCSICVFPGKASAGQLMVATQKMTGETVVPRSDCDDPFTFRGIRAYQSHDSIRDINWKASAKTGDLRVNIHDYTADQEIAIVLDTEWDSLLRPEDLLEESIRIAASLADEFVGKGVSTSVISNGKDCLTGERFVAGSGANAEHSRAISYGLARVKLLEKRETETLSSILREEIEQMNAHPDRKVSWVLISTQTGSEVVEAWKELGEKAVKSYWIIPAHKREDVAPELLMDPEVMYWEVAYGK